MTTTRPSLDEALAHIGLTEASTMLGMHLTEIEDEADTLLDLLITVRTHSRTGDALAGQLGLVEFVTALEHLVHHAQEALPALKKALDIDLDDEGPADESIDQTEAAEKELQTA